MQAVRWRTPDSALHPGHSQPGCRALRHSGCERHCMAAGERSSRQLHEQVGKQQRWAAPEAGEDASCAELPVTWTGLHKVASHDF